LREVRPDAIREYGAIRFRSDYHYSLFEYYRSAKILTQLERAGIRPRGRVLDAGCGGGGVAVSFAEESQFAVGLDLVDRFKDAGERLAKEREIGNVSFVRGDGLSLPFESDSFDLVLSHSVIEHVDSPEDYLRECFRVLQPKGVLYLSTPPYYSSAGSHLARLKIPIPYQLLLPRRWAFRLNFYLAREHPTWLEQQGESNSCRMAAARGGTKEDDLAQRVTLGRVRLWLRSSGFKVLQEKRQVSGFFAREVPSFIRRFLERNRYTQSLVYSNLEYLLMKPAPPSGPTASSTTEKDQWVPV
jgi:SAM-dependent methyltransferase